METPTDKQSENGPVEQPRRGFLSQALALVAGGITVLVPATVAVIAGLNPLRQKGSTGTFRKLAALAAVPEDGTPRRFPVIADRTDAWNRQANQAIGAVFLRRVDGKQVEALQVICPHAGCTIQYEPGQKGGRFVCPCHEAMFSLNGQRLDKASSISPRDMDTLEVEIRKENEVWVKFEDFVTGTDRKVAKV